MIPVTSLNRIMYLYKISYEVICNILHEDKRIIGDVTG